MKKQLVGGAQGLTNIAEPSSNNAGTQKLGKVKKKKNHIIELSSKYRVVKRYKKTLKELLKIEFFHHQWKLRTFYKSTKAF